MIKSIDKLPREFKNILPDISRISAKLGYRIYLVGGVVRDFILNKPILDLDIVVEGDAINLAQELASNFNVKFRKHHSFGTATVNFKECKLDLVTARREVYIHPGALPKVTASSLKDDLFRRDFTINALALSLNSNDYGKIIDYYKGLNDLNKGIIRVLHDNSFIDDPTRIMRAIRFEQRFRFKIEDKTFYLLKAALAKGALSYVHRHRLTDEFIHILKESNPYPYIKRIEQLYGFSFLHKKIKLYKDDYALFLEIKEAIQWYHKKFTFHRKLDIWIIYFSVFLVKLSLSELLELFHGFCLKKGDRIRIVSIKDNLNAFKKLNKKIKPYAIFKIIDHLSFESIIFLYAYYKEKQIRKNIEYFFSTLVNIRLKTRGLDLQNLNIQPTGIYTKLLTKLLEVKMNKNLDAQAELSALNNIIKKFK